MDEPLEFEEAKRLILEILDKKTNVAIRDRYTDHAEDRTVERGVSTLECLAGLRAGRVVGRELRNGTWRYRVEAAMVCIMVAFRSETEFVIVTAWRRED